MKKLEINQTEILSGGSKCDVAMGAVIGYAAAGFMAGGPAGLAIGIVFGAVGLFGASQCA